MGDEARLGPEEALERLQIESATKRAKLKIFFGMSAGVGKTYAMLKEARVLLERGEDLVIGWVEAHGRKETDALLEGIERITPRFVEYRGIRIAEMDLDAVLARAPRLALVDELAHSNSPGLRHAKRYEDVLELLDAGISVYTTVNIQHLESMADSVELVTLVPIRERVPDSVFDRADEIQMVDIPPDELIQRLNEGKVYTGQASSEAVKGFFTKSNLAVLREIALRQASQLASHQLLGILRGAAPRSSSASSQRILVAVSPSPHGENLVRWARRLAYSLKADWDCVNVETGQELDEKDKTRLEANLTLARSLGARVTSLPSRDVVTGLLKYAVSNNVSVIVIGKSGLSGARGPFSRRTLAERIIKESGNVPVFAVQERPFKEPIRKKIAARMGAAPGWQYLASVAVIGAVTALNAFLVGVIGYWAVSIPYLAAISLLALALERKPVLLAALLSALCWDFLFIPPHYTFVIAKTEDYLMLGLYFLVAITSGWMTGALRANERMLVVRERRMSLLSDLASELAGSSGVGVIVTKGVGFLERAFDAQALVILDDGDGRLKNEPEGGWAALDEKAMSAARYAYSSGRSAGRYTGTLPVVEWHFAPMDTPQGRIGVVGLRPALGTAWSEDLESFLRTMSRTLSIAVQRELLAEREATSALAAESERLGSLLLDSVSHELRTPLAIIQGSASALADEATAEDPMSRRELVDEIRGGAERLDGIVENLLSMNRLESGALSLRIEESGPEDLVSSALAAVREELGGRTLSVDLAGVGRPLFCDEGLIVQVLVNLLRNSARYAGPTARIEVGARSERGSTVFRVRDDGPGLRDADLPHIFDKFYRADRSQPGGTGLGLAICKGIVEAHGGRIAARNALGGGFLVEFELPDGSPKAGGGGRP